MGRVQSETILRSGPTSSCIKFLHNGTITVGQPTNRYRITSHHLKPWSETTSHAAKQHHVSTMPRQAAINKPAHNGTVLIIR